MHNSGDDQHFQVDRRLPDTLTVEADPLKLDLEDDVLVQVIDDRIEKSASFYKRLGFAERRKRNKEYWMGEQQNQRELKDYQARYVDNLIYEAEKTIEPIAMSRLPEITVKPGKEEEESQQTAKDLSEIFNTDLRKRNRRKVLGLAHRQLPIHLGSVIKAFWDPRKGRDGDYGFKVVHPDNFVADHTSPDNDTENMDFVAEAAEYSIKELEMMFPNSADELRERVYAEKFSSEGGMGEKRMASKIKVWEVWFRWYKKTTDEETGKEGYETINAVVWKYKDLILHKMKQPYWDWEGEKKFFKMEMGQKREVNDEDIRSLLFGGDEVTSQQFFHNYFDGPRFPYFIMGYDGLGEHPMDATSRIEQIISLQDNTNKRGRQITEMNDRSKGKHVFSTDSGLTASDIERMDMDNPDEDIVVDGDIGKVHNFIQGTPAPAPLYTEQEQERNKAFSKVGTHSTTRGEKRSDVATTNQILREADFGRIDDLVENTINPAAEWMAEWSMQFIKLFYTEEHTRRILGADGQVVFKKIKRDSVEDGMEVTIGASGVDKIEAKRTAFELAKMQMIDPLTLFIDLGVSDPMGRANKLMSFMLSPPLYMQNVLQGRNTQGMADALGQISAQEAQQPPPQGQLQPTPQEQPQIAGGGNYMGGGWHGYGGGNGMIDPFKKAFGQGYIYDDVNSYLSKNA